MGQFTLRSIGIKSGKALIRYSISILSDEEIISMEENLAKETEKRVRLHEIYEKAKAENENRAQLEAQREKVSLLMYIDNIFNFVRRLNYAINNFWKKESVNFNV